MISPIHFTSVVTEPMHVLRHRQAALADLIAAALADTDLTGLAQRAVTLLTGCLDTESAQVLELAPDGTHLLSRAGVGWGQELTEPGPIKVSPDSPAGYAVITNQPLIIEDLRTDPRFHRCTLPERHGVISGMITIVGDRSGPWGVLGTYTSVPRQFREDEAELLRAAADVLALVVQRRYLEGTQAQFSAIADSLKNAIIVTDRQGAVLRWSPGAAALTGHAASQVTGRRVWDLLPLGPEEDPDRLREWIEREAAVPEREVTILRGDGQWIETSLSLSFARARGEAILVLRDRTDQRRLAVENGTLRARERAALARLEMAEAAREGEARFRRLLDQIRDYAIILLDPAGRVSSWNEGARKIFGHQRDEILGKHASILYATDSRAAGALVEKISQATDHGRAEQIGWHERKGGARFRARTMIHAICDEASRLSSYAIITHELSECGLATDLLLPTPETPLANGGSRAEEHDYFTRFLPTVPILRDLPPQLIRRLASLSPIKRYQAGQFIFLEEDPIAALHILAEGHVKMIRETEEGRGVILRLINPGEIFGLAGFDGQMAQRLSAQAIDPVTVIEIPIEEFIRALSASPGSLQSTLHTIGTMMREIESRICDLQTKGAESRLAGVLVRLADSERSADGRIPLVTLSLTRQDLADLAGTNLSTASRAVSAWAKGGLIVVGRAKITIREDAPLRAIAQGTRARDSPGRSE